MRRLVWKTSFTYVHDSLPKIYWLVWETSFTYLNETTWLVSLCPTKNFPTQCFKCLYCDRSCSTLVLLSSIPISDKSSKIFSLCLIKSSASRVEYRAFEIVLWVFSTLGWAILAWTEDGFCNLRTICLFVSSELDCRDEDSDASLWVGGFLVYSNQPFEKIDAFVCEGDNGNQEATVVTWEKEFF